MVGCGVCELIVLDTLLRKISLETSSRGSFSKKAKETTYVASVVMMVVVMRLLHMFEKKP